jgi:hypothetical protein
MNDINARALFVIRSADVRWEAHMPAQRHTLLAGADVHVADLSNVYGVVEAGDDVFGLRGVGSGVELQEKARGDEGGFEKGFKG